MRRLSHRSGDARVVRAAPKPLNRMEFMGAPGAQRAADDETPAQTPFTIGRRW